MDKNSNRNNCIKIQDDQLSCNRNLVNIVKDVKLKMKVKVKLHDIMLFNNDESG